jgi:hypothetical protein
MTHVEPRRPERAGTRRALLPALAVLAGLVGVGVGCTEDVGPQQARWSELERAQTTLLAEAHRRDDEFRRRAGGLAASSAGPRQELDDADADARAALAEWDAQLKSSARIVGDALQAGDGVAAARALRAERLRLDEARQTAQDAHVARQRALSVVVDEIAALRAKARGIAEQSAAQHRAANRAAAEGGELRFAIVFVGNEVDGKASEAELRRLEDLLGRCRELAVDLLGGGANAEQGRARALRLRAVLESRGVVAGKLRGLGGVDGDGVVVRVATRCPPPPPPEE